MAHWTIAATLNTKPVSWKIQAKRLTTVTAHVAKMIEKHGFANIAVTLWDDAKTPFAYPVTTRHLIEGKWVVESHGTRQG